jgi:hypothetical protein
MVNCRTVNQRRGRGDNTIATGFNNAVVLSFTQAKIIRITISTRSIADLS